MYVYIYIYIYIYISISKGNQAMKFGQLIEYNMKKHFSLKIKHNVVERLGPDPFLKNQ